MNKYIKSRESIELYLKLKGNLEFRYESLQTSIGLLTIQPTTLV